MAFKQESGSRRGYANSDCSISVQLSRIRNGSKTLLHKTPYVAVEGPIGAGKTSLVERLAKLNGFVPVLEDVSDNPHLSAFHTDAKHAAFATQVHYLSSRLQQNRTISLCRQAGQGVIADYSFVEKERLFANLFLEKHYQQTYWALRAAIENDIIQPTVVVLLDAAPEVLLERVRERARPFEQNLSLGFVEALRRAYAQDFRVDPPTVLLRIDTTTLDPRTNDEHLQAIQATLLRALNQRLDQPGSALHDDRGDTPW